MNIQPIGEPTSPVRLHAVIYRNDLLSILEGALHLIASLSVGVVQKLEGIEIKTKSNKDENQKESEFKTMKVLWQLL